jgi:hypothetical protein
MSNDFAAHVSTLASNFASAIVAAICSASVADLQALAAETSTATPSTVPRLASKNADRPSTSVAKPATANASKAATKASTAPAAKAAGGVAKPARKTSGRLARRSPAEIAEALSNIVDLVRSVKGGLRAEQIRARLGMESKEMPRVLKEGLAKKALKSKGQKRSTTYTAA